jgi:hypothetical protein
VTFNRFCFFFLYAFGLFLFPSFAFFFFALTLFSLFPPPRFFLGALFVGPLLGLAPLAGFGAFAFSLPFFAQLCARFARFLFRLDIGIGAAPAAQEQEASNRHQSHWNPHRSLHEPLAFAKAM